MKPSHTLAILFSLAAPGASGCDSMSEMFTGGNHDWPATSCEVPTCDPADSTGDDPTEFTARTCLAEMQPAAAGDALDQLDATVSCDELTDYVKDILLRTARLTMERNLQQALQLSCQACYDYDHWGGGVDGGVSDPGDDPGADDYSETNTQVPGIDEADFVKNDGNYLYVLGPGHLRIIDAWPADQAHVVSTLPLPGTPKRMYVHGARAIVYSTEGWTGTPECTYGFDCDFVGDGAPMTISIVDIADRSAPHLIRQLHTNGAYLSSRRIGDIVHTAVIAAPLSLPHLEEWPASIPRYVPSCGESIRRPGAREIADAFQTLWQENRARIAALTLSDIMPTLTDRTWHDGVPSEVETRLAVCNRSYLSRTHDGFDLITLMSLDTTDDGGDPGLTTVVGGPGAVYASPDALYLAEPRRFWDYDYYGGGESDKTSVHKFRLTDGSTQTSYAGSGSVPGHVLNQFAMDEQDGVLRIATTTGWNQDNTVTTLHEGEEGLEQMGQISGIAPYENIRSVRFQGDIGYMVTFKKTDPLFVLDLSDPAHPALRGELHIPGFSTYLHMLDADHILSIGFDAEDMGTFAWFQGLMLQIMDVGDMDAPSLIYKEVIGTRGSASDAATNHLAFNYHAPRQLLAIPMVVCEDSSGGGDYGSHVSFDGLQVYRVTLEDGFTLLGGIPHAEPYDSDYDCYNWWSQSSSPVQRSVFMEDWVFAIAADKIQVAPLADLANPVIEIAP